MNFPMQIERITSTSPSHYFAQLAEIHSSEIKEGFLPKLGMKFLQGLYQEISNSDHAFIIIAHQDEKIGGFICGTTNLRRVYCQYLLHRGVLDLWGLIPVFMTPRRITSLVETLVYPCKSSKAKLPQAEIMNFCVRGTLQRTGLGKRLFHQLVREFKQRGTSEIRIVTGGNQYKAQRFYESLGAKKIEEIEIHKGSSSIIYTFDTSLDVHTVLAA